MNDALQSAAESLSAAVRALVLALALLLLQALRVVALAAVPVARLACVIAAAWVAVGLYSVIFERYGQDVPASVLALLVSVWIIVAVLVLGHGRFGLSPRMLACASIEFAGRVMLAHAPVVVLGILPASAIALVMLYNITEAEKGKEMDKVGKAAGTILLWVLAGGLMIYTIPRNVELIQTTLPPEFFNTAYAAIAGLEGGSWAWFLWTTRSARGGQRAVGYGMLMVDLFGISAGVVADTLRVGDTSGATNLMVANVAMYLVPITIALNVIAAFVAHLLDPEQSVRDAEAEAEYAIRRAYADGLKNQAHEVARGVVPAAVLHRQEQMSSGFLSAITGKLDRLGNNDGKLTFADVAAWVDANRNGTSKKPATATMQATAPEPVVVATVPASQPEPVPASGKAPSPRTRRAKAANVPAEPPQQ